MNSHIALNISTVLFLKYIHVHNEKFLGKNFFSFNLNDFVIQIFHTKWKKKLINCFFLMIDNKIQLYFLLTNHF